ncbi:PUA-like domain-containing protein [Ganoderma leucocontextum]|nr:PUA-like domain-containing protein [Ganoderma leucocontextum]
MGFSSKPSIKRTQPSTVFGHIPGVPVGSTFENRLFLHHASVHSGIMAGINGTKREGCYSVVLSGGYEDDKDEGYRFTYTGCGGRDKKDGEKPREGPQTCDQTWENTRNASLRVSAHTKKPVRVVRGYSSSSDFAPVKGYRYDGLYLVDQAWMSAGKSGFKVCKFILSCLPDQPPIPRREGTLNLDLSRWEEPRHFWNGSPSSPTAPVGKGKERTHGNAEAGPSQARSKPHVKLPPPAPILPTTNIAAARARHPGPSQAQASTSAPVMDVTALLAEMRGVAAKPPPVSTPTAAVAGPSRPPASAPSSWTTDPRKRPPSTMSAPAPTPAKAGPSPPLPPAPANRSTDPRSRPSSTTQAGSPPSRTPQRGAPLTPVQNAAAIRRKRSFDADGDGPEDLKRAKIVGLKGGQHSPQKGCPGSRPEMRSPIKQETREVVPRWDGGVIDLTGSDEED